MDSIERWEQVVRGALGGTVAGALVGWASPATGVVAAASAAASVADLQSASSLAEKAAFSMATVARLAGEALLRFLKMLYSTSYEVPSSRVTFWSKDMLFLDTYSVSFPSHTRNSFVTTSHPSS